MESAVSNVQGTAIGNGAAPASPNWVDHIATECAIANRQRCTSTTAVDGTATRAGPIIIQSATNNFECSSIPDSAAITEYAIAGARRVIGAEGAVVDRERAA